MWYSLVASAKNITDNGSNVSAQAMDTSGANLLVAAIGYAQGVATPSITDSYGNSFVPLTRQATSVVASQIYYAKSSAAGGDVPIMGSNHVVICTRTGAFATICVAAFSGAPQLYLFDKQNGAVVVGAGTIQPGSVTPVYDNSLIIAADARGVTGTMAIDSGFTLAQQNPYSASAPVRWGASLSYKIQTSLAAVNPTITQPSSGNSAATIAVFTDRQIVPVLTDLSLLPPLYGTSAPHYGPGANRVMGGRTSCRGGLYHIAGTTTCEDLPVGRNVFLMRHLPGNPVNGDFVDLQRTVDGVGAFDFRYLQSGVYTILSVDPAGLENDVIRAGVIAVMM